MNEFEIKALLKFLNSFDIVKIVSLDKSDNLYVYFKYKDLLLVVSFSIYSLKINEVDTFFDVIETSILDHSKYIENMFFGEIDDELADHIPDIMCDLICFHYLSMVDIRFSSRPNEQKLYWNVISKIRKLYKEDKSNIEVFKETIDYIEYDPVLFENYLRSL